MDEGGSREQLEQQIATLKTANLALQDQLRSADDAVRLIQEMEVHQIELQAQNMALREVQRELEVSRAQYADLYDFAPIAYFTLDPAGVVLETNLRGAALLGRERVMITGR